MLCEKSSGRAQKPAFKSHKTATANPLPVIKDLSVPTDRRDVGFVIEQE